MGLWNIIRPVCPACDGKGGSMSGYYEPEFDSCRCCNRDDQNDEEVTHVWRWQWWRFKFNQWREDRAIDKWVEQEMRREDFR